VQFELFILKNHAFSLEKAGSSRETAVGTHPEKTYWGLEKQGWRQKIF
jgi:hypothetical protein